MNWEEYTTNLWTERLVLIRQLILTIMLNLRDTKFVSQCVQRNNAELGQILGNVYGSEAGQKFEQLLGEYIRILSQIAFTIKSGGNTDPLMEQWGSIAEKIADFLSQLNPYWEKPVVKGLINDEMNLEFGFASDFKAKQYQECIPNFDVAYDKARQAAQLMIYGIKMYLNFQEMAEPTES